MDKETANRRLGIAFASFMIALIVGGIAYREMFNRGYFGVPSLPTTARSHPVNRSKPPQEAEPVAKEAAETAPDITRKK